MCKVCKEKLPFVQLWWIRKARPVRMWAKQLGKETQPRKCARKTRICLLRYDRGGKLTELDTHNKLFYYYISERRLTHYLIFCKTPVRIKIWWGTLKSFPFRFLNLWTNTFFNKRHYELTDIKLIIHASDFILSVESVMGLFYLPPSKEGCSRVILS